MEDSNDEIRYRLVTCKELLEGGIDLEIEAEPSDFHQLRFIEVSRKNGKSFFAVKELLELKRDFPTDYNKLRMSIKRLMMNHSVFFDRERIEKGDSKKTENIIEIKANNGNSRLMAFVENEKLRIFQFHYGTIGRCRHSQLCR